MVKNIIVIAVAKCHDFIHLSFMKTYSKMLLNKLFFRHCCTLHTDTNSTGTSTSAVILERRRSIIGTLGYFTVQSSIGHVARLQ